MSLSDARASALLLQMKHSQQEANKIIRDLQSIQRGMAGVAKEAKVVGAGAVPIDKVTTAIKKQDAQVRALSKSADAAAKEFDQLRASMKGAADVDIGAGADAGVVGKRRTISPRLTAIGREVRALPATGIPGTGVTSDAISKVVAVIGSLPAVAGPVLVALGGIGAAFVALEASIAEAKKSLDAAIASVTFYFTETRRLTTEQNREQLNDTQQTLQDRRDELALLEEEFGDVWGRIGEDGSLAFSGLELTLAKLSTTDDSAAARVAQLIQEITSLEGEEQALIRAYDDGSAARNDLTEATRAATEAEIDLLSARTQAILQGGQAIAANEQTRQQILAASTVEELDRLRESFEVKKAIIDAELDFLEAQYRDLRNSPLIQDAIAQIQALHAAGQPIPEDLQAIVDPLRQLEDRMSQLGTQSSELQSNFIPLIDSLYGTVAALEIAKEKEDARIAALEESAAALEKTTAEIAKTHDEIAKLTADNAAKIKAIAETLNEKLAEAERDRNEALADAEGDANEAHAEAQIEANEEIEQLRESHLKNLAKIEREFNRSAAAAVQDRDSVARDRAEQAREDALADEAESYEDSRKQVSKQLAKTNAEIDRRLIEQRNTAIRRYNEQLQAAHAAANKAREIEVAKYNAELAAKNQHLNQLQAQQTAYQAAALGMQKNFWDAALQLASNAVKAIGGSSLGSGKPNVPNPGTPPKLPNVPPKFDSGAPAFIRQRMTAILGPGDVVIPPGNKGFGGINLTLNGLGMSKSQVREEAHRVLDDAIERAYQGAA
jgi:hypothetical protein